MLVPLLILGCAVAFAAGFCLGRLSKDSDKHGDPPIWDDDVWR